MKQLFFLSGLARSGSTLLGSILNQNPNINVTPTSPLLDLYCYTQENLEKLSVQYTYDKVEVGKNIYKSLHQSFYQNIDKQYIFDKHRGWPKNLDIVKKLITPNPKVVCTYRPMAEVIVSVLKLMKDDPKNSVDKELFELGKIPTTEERALHLWNHYAADPYFSFKYGLEHHKENILVLNYDDIVFDTQNQLKRIYDFTGIEPYDGHIFDNINNTCVEHDNGWAFKGLHNIRSKLEKTSDDAIKVLGEKLYNQFCELDKQLNL